MAAAVEAMALLRDDLTLLLAWEIGKPWEAACADVDRCLDGVRWYLDNAEQMLAQDTEGPPYKRQVLCSSSRATRSSATSIEIEALISIEVADPSTRGRDETR
ncbi:aldehyde dehydrogenase family protein [Saccharopolyspora hattusasensis]|uniref:aldehyde dehydrogenase family protein n=1 Tax=Saccharopolyspora hattusasensis TaxID=1128679 RepID=UPI003D98ADD7